LCFWSQGVDESGSLASARGSVSDLIKTFAHASGDEEWAFSTEKELFSTVTAFGCMIMEKVVVASW